MLYLRLPFSHSYCTPEPEGYNNALLAVYVFGLIPSMEIDALHKQNLHKYYFLAQTDDDSDTSPWCKI